MTLDLSGVTLLETLTSGAVVTGSDGLIVYANPAFQAMLLGESNMQLAGKRVSDFLALPPKADCALCLGAGSQWASMHGALLRVGLDAGAEELRVKIKHSSLPDAQVLCLVDPFSEDAALTQAHSDFVSTVSHEFRTPLTSIKGFADTLLHYGAQLPEEEKRRFVTIIKAQADRLIRLVENLLTVSKLGVGRGEMSYRPVSLQKAIERAVQSVQAKHQTKTPGAVHRFETVIHPATLEAWADPDRLDQILINLIDNAAKYSPAGSIVHIRCELFPGDEGMVRITVRDEGVGIPQDVLPKIFTKFYRVESPLKQEVEGTGLGLYITKSLTDAMGGRIEAQSAPGQGTTFTVALPAATPERQATHRRKLYADEGATLHE